MKCVCVVVTVVKSPRGAPARMTQNDEVDTIVEIGMITT